MTKFEQLTEEKKKIKVFNYALMRCQSMLFLDVPAIEEYKKELKAMTDWIKKETGQDDLKFY